MMPEPRHPPTVPSYGAAALADLSSSMLASVDPEAPDSQNVLGLPAARRACLLIVDGLGWELLRAHPAVAPFLSELALNSRPITAGFPSTTVTSLGSICTGRPPGQHGILGYQVIIPGENRLLNGLRWDSRIDPRQWQSLPTIYERAAAAGIAAVHVAQGSFRGTGLTVATMRGASYRPADSMGALAARGAAGDVLATWREVLGERAWVMSRDEAIKEGWFGPVDPSLADRIGDVVAAPVGSLAIVASRTEPRESALVGLHGSLTSADQLVPALSSSVI